MTTFVKQIQNIVNEYRLGAQKWPATKMEIAVWAHKNGKFILPESEVLKKMANEIGRAMREEFFIDKKGRKVRLKHPITISESGKNLTLWDDFRTAPRIHMTISFQQRRQRIVGNCRQLKTDVDSYNDKNHNEKPIQMVFDFRNDLAELEITDVA